MNILYKSDIYIILDPKSVCFYTQVKIFLVVKCFFFICIYKHEAKCLTNFLTGAW